MTSASAIELPVGTVHLWYTSAPHTRIPLDQHLSILDEEERCRAARFHFDRDRDLFILARASLRRLLARYTGADPAQIQFKQNPYGKLFIDHPVSSVRFNVAHSGDCIVHAIAQGTEVGVDVEVLRNSGELASISSYFASGEQAWLLAADAQARDTGFFTLWTCKEAYIKALGRGLSKPLNSFEVSLADGGKPRILSDSEDNAHLNSWRLMLFEPRRNVLGCVAVDVASTLVELRDYDSGVLLQRIV
jgi:4'-phosphopantetheinyl transferase